MPVTFTKSTGYALHAALAMAGAAAPVTVGEIAGRHRIPPGALAKVFQQLVRAGIAEGQRGVGGGYRLARPASSITVLEVISVFETATRPATDLRIRRLLDEVDEIVRSTFASVTLETLVGKVGNR